LLLYVRQNQKRNIGVVVHERVAVLGEKTESSLLIFCYLTETRREKGRVILQKI